MVNTNASSVVVVIVLYNPKDKEVSNVKRLSLLYDGVIVDNSCQRNFPGDYVNKMRYVSMGKNVGIAAAQNVGIKCMMERFGCCRFVFLDQDSACNDSYPSDIAEEYGRLKKDLPNLATLGPMVVDADTSNTYSSSIYADKFILPGVVVRTHIISSGSCVDSETLSAVGLYDERLFIDYVDSEWCWRATSLGLACCITSKLSMSHRIGRKRISVGIFKDIVSSPNRYYFQYRNYIWLAFLGYVPLRWKVNTGIKNIVRLFYFPLFIKDGVESCLYMWRGIFSGMARPKMLCRNRK